LQTINEYDLIKPNDRILIAFSGGVDSVVLTYLLTKFREYLKISDIYLAHLNHKLRGLDAEENVRFVKDFARKYNLRLFLKDVDIKKLSKERKQSIELVGREERYKFFKDILKKYNLNKLATAHHLSDLAETLTLWFIQGNKKGMKGFYPKENNIIRPLYLLKKNEIEDYAYKKGLDYHLDKSNFETEYLRNKVRHKILPLMRKINPSIENSLKVLSDFLKFDEEFFNEYVNSVGNKYMEGDKLKLDIVYEKPAIQYRIIQRWLNRLGINPSYIQLEEILKLLKKGGYKEYFLKGDTILVKDYNFLYLTKKKDKNSEFFYKIKPNTEIYLKESGIRIKAYFINKVDLEKLKKDKNIECFEIDDNNPEFILRSRRAGDKIRLFGGGEKKLKDLFIDLKIPKNMRDLIAVLEYNNNILWIVGYKRSALYPIGDLGKRLICFEIKEV